MKFIILGAAALALAVPTLSLAQPREDQSVSVAVSYADLDLSRPHEARILLERVSRAALEACGASEASLPEYKDAVRRSACYRENIEQAVAAIHAPTVSALYNEHPTVAAGQ